MGVRVATDAELTASLARSKARRADRLLIALSGASLVPLALSGHTSQESEDIAASSMIVHVLAAGGVGGRPCGRLVRTSVRFLSGSARRSGHLRQSMVHRAAPPWPGSP